MEDLYLIEPIENPRITQEFGLNPQIYDQFGMDGHNGRDYGHPIGTPIYASADGKIIRVMNDKVGYGLHIRQWAENIGELVYAHLSKANVGQNDVVKEGQLIGWVGNTGFSTGPHLHFGFRPIGYDYKNGYLGYVDPKPYLISKQNYMTLIDDVQRLTNDVEMLKHENHLRKEEVKEATKVNKKQKKTIEKLKPKNWKKGRIDKVLERLKIKK